MIDSLGKTALEYARDTNSRGALEQLQRGAPLSEPKLQQLVVSKKARSSMCPTPIALIKKSSNSDEGTLISSFRDNSVEITIRKQK